jgi:endonuclease YncB( thermonuclease family)
MSSEHPIAPPQIGKIILSCRPQRACSQRLRLRPIRSLTFLLAALVFFIPEVAQSQVQPGQTFTARVTSVTDGDTYDVRRSTGGEVTVRLHGVDAPESAQPYGTAATKAARQYIGGKNVRVRWRRSAATAALWPV